MATLTCIIGTMASHDNSNGIPPIITPSSSPSIDHATITAPAAAAVTSVHYGYTCVACHASPIIGARYVCLSCGGGAPSASSSPTTRSGEIHLCSACELRHDQLHTMMKITIPMTVPPITNTTTTATTTPQARPSAASPPPSSSASSSSTSATHMSDDEHVASLASIIPTLDPSIAPYTPSPQLLPSAVGPSADVLGAYRRSVSMMMDTEPSSSLSSLHFTHSSFPISRTTLLAMLRRESELRLSPATQLAYSHARAMDPDGLEGLVEVTNACQRQTAIEFGYDNADDDTAYDAISRGVSYLRAATSLFPGDDEIVNAAHWIKYNRARAGCLRLGDICPSHITLYPLSASPTTTATPAPLSLSKVFTSMDPSNELFDSPLVIFAASWSCNPFRGALPFVRQLAAEFASSTLKLDDTNHANDSNSTTSNTGTNNTNNNNNNNPAEKKESKTNSTTKRTDVRMMMIYILEAHATDEWRIGRPPIDRYQPHKTGGSLICTSSTPSSLSPSFASCATGTCSLTTTSSSSSRTSDDEDVMCDPSDGGEGCIRQHHTIDARLAAAQRFVTATRFPTDTIPVYIDSINEDESFESSFAAWPTRCYIIHRGRIAFIGWPTRVTEQMIAQRTVAAAAAVTIPVPLSSSSSSPSSVLSEGMGMGMALPSTIQRSVPAGEYEFNFHDVHTWLTSYCNHINAITTTRPTTTTPCS